MILFIYELVHIIKKTFVLFFFFKVMFKALFMHSSWTSYLSNDRLIYWYVMNALTYIINIRKIVIT